MDRIYALAALISALPLGYSSQGVPSDFAERYPHEIVQSDSQEEGGLYGQLGKPNPLEKIGKDHPLETETPGMPVVRPDQPQPEPTLPPSRRAPPEQPEYQPAPQPSMPSEDSGITPGPLRQPEVPQQVQPTLPPPPPMPTRPAAPTPSRPRAEREERVETLGSPLPLYTQEDITIEMAKKPAVGDRTVYIINYHDVPIAEYIRFISQISGTNFVFDENDLQFNITIVSEEPTSIEHIMSVLLQILSSRGLEMTEQGNQILIYKPDSTILGKMGTVVSPENPIEPPPPIVTRVFRLHSASAKTVQGIVEPLLSKDALVQISEATGHLIVTDVAGNIDKVGELLKSIDSPTPKQEVALYHVKNMAIGSLIPLAQKILGPLGVGKITLVPQLTTNTIFVVAPPFAIQRSLSILQTLDVATIPAGGLRGTERGEAVPADLEGTSFYIYKLQNHRGDEMVQALREIATSLEASGAESTDLISTIGTIQWIQGSNSLVISGNRNSIDKVKLLIQDLDIPLNQVMIEVLALRTTIANSLNIGVEWGSAISYLNPPDGSGQNVQFGGGSTQGTGSQLNNRLDPVQGPNPIPPLQEGLALGVVGRFLSFNGTMFTSVGAFINALQVDDNSKVLFNPKILTQDNHTARLFVGQNIAFRESTISEPGSQILSGQIEYRDVGQELIITPILGEGDMVTLEVSHSIGNIQGTGSGGESGTTNPVFKSDTETRVSVPDGYFLVISGSIQDTQQEIQKGLPCLGGLPILGAAFSTQTKLDSRDNLIIFIRPHIIRSRADMVRVTEMERSHYENASEQTEFQLDATQITRLLNINCLDDPLERHGRHDHYYDPCYEHDPCDPYCLD